MTTPTRILLSDDLYALAEEDDVRDVNRSIYTVRPSAHPDELRAHRNGIAPATETPRQMRPSPLVPMLAAGISGAVVGALIVVVLT